MRTAMPTTTAKNSSKYDDCTLECRNLAPARGRNSKNFLGICLASWRNIPSFFYSQSLKQRNKTLMTSTMNKRVNQKCDFSEPSSFAFPSSLLKVPIHWNNVRKVMGSIPIWSSDTF